MMQRTRPAPAAAPVHDWLRPRLLALLADSEKAGLPRETVVAVIIDIVGAPPFDASDAQSSPPAEPVAADAGGSDPVGMELESEFIRAEAEQAAGDGVPEISKPLL
ncbi:MAG: hypothetical protein ACREF1_03915 [Acetobacteraceae bacterium]